VANCGFATTQIAQRPCRAVLQRRLQSLSACSRHDIRDTSSRRIEKIGRALVAAPLRLLHYPPAQITDQRQLGSSAHTDFGAITLLLQDGNPGLEVYDEASQTWHEIEPTRNAYVVNVGDMLEMWTGHRFKSSLHRVINKKPVDRYSVVFFFDGNLDCGLSSLDGSAADEKGLTVEQHMISRMTQSYHGKDPRGAKASS
jgi:isopenicillin N synthase-like dioxygenase